MFGLFHGRRKRNIGDDAEALALSILKQSGFSLVAQNYIAKRGEIDLIVERDKTLVFVEVRYRGKGAYVQAVETVDARKLHKISLTAEHFIQSSPQYSDYVQRIDVMAFDDLSSNGLTWLENISG